MRQIRSLLLLVLAGIAASNAVPVVQENEAHRGSQQHTGAANRLDKIVNVIHVPGVEHGPVELRQSPHILDGALQPSSTPQTFADSSAYADTPPQDFLTTESTQHGDSSNRHVGRSMDTYTTINGLRHQYKFHSRGKSWADAVNICEMEGAYLAEPDSETEAQILGRLFNTMHSIVDDDTTIYVGISARNPEGVFKTTRGQLLSDMGYSKWDIRWGYPSRPFTDTCVTMWEKGEYWNWRCNVRMAFFCEKDT